MADAAYGLWPLVVLNTALFCVFAVSFFRPHTKRDWRAMGAFTAFLVALFTGHLWNDLIGWIGDPHLSPFHLASYVAIGGGFWLISVAWRRLHEAAREDRLRT